MYFPPRISTTVNNVGTGASEILGEDVSPTNVAPGTGRGGRRRTSVTSEPGHVTASAAKHSEIVNGNAVAGVFLRRDVKGPPRPSRMLSKFTTLSMRRTSLSGSDSSTATMVAAGGGVTGTASGEGRTQSRRQELVRMVEGEESAFFVVKIS